MVVYQLHYPSSVIIYNHQSAENISEFMPRTDIIKLGRYKHRDTDWHVFITDVRTEMSRLHYISTELSSPDSIRIHNFDDIFFSVVCNHEVDLFMCGLFTGKVS